MKRLLYTGGLLAILACSLQAQTQRATANIPFDFHMGDSVMPAGKYDVQTSYGVLKVHSQTANKSVVRLTFATTRPEISSNPKLAFTRYGSQYFLAAVWTESSHDGRGLPKSKQERQLIRDRELVQTASVSLH